MNIAEIASCCAALISALALWRSIHDGRSDKYDKRFDKLEDKMDDMRKEITDVRNDVSQIKERVAGIEMSTIFLHLNPTPPSRSEVAKKIWEKRKSAQIEKKKD